MEPTLYEVIFWFVLLIAFGGGILWAIRRDERPHNDDPYRYCPKEDEVQ